MKLQEQHASPSNRFLRVSMRWYLGTIFLLAVLLLTRSNVHSQGIASPVGPIPPGSDEPIRLGDSRGGCTLVTFEGLGDWEPIPPMEGDVTVTFGDSWLSTIDEDAGGAGHFANEPSPDTAAFYLLTTDISIYISPAVQFVEMFYVASAASVPITLTAYDSEGGVLATATGATVGTSTDGAVCEGDPTGHFCLWDAIAVSSSEGNIVRVEITGSSGNEIGFDNMLFCRHDAMVGACCLPTGSCSVTSEEGCIAAGGIFLPTETCEDTSCAPTPVEYSSWGRIKSLYR